MTRTNLAIVLIATASGAVAGVLTNALVSDRPSVGAVASLEGDGRVAKLEEQNAALQRAIAELREGQALLASRGERTAVGAGTAPERASAAALPEASAETPVEVAGTPLSIEAALARLCDPEASYAERSAMWEEVNKAGLLHAVVEAMEQRVDREPNNPALRVELGNAYLQELFAGNLMKRGYWGTKADEAFDAALELDPQHWEARFTKAVSLSNWPAFTGKQGQAIAEFETLIAQQNAGPKQPHHAQTYLFLGNMYQASGSPAKALEAWQQGAALFPDNPSLQEQLANAKKL